VEEAGKGAADIGVVPTEAAERIMTQATQLIQKTGIQIQMPQPPTRGRGNSPRNNGGKPPTRGCGGGGGGNGPISSNGTSRHYSSSSNFFPSALARDEARGPIFSFSNHTVSPTSLSSYHFSNPTFTRISILLFKYSTGRRNESRDEPQSGEWRSGQLRGYGSVSCPFPVGGGTILWCC
jgi:hypothetical protein